MAQIPCPPVATQPATAKAASKAMASIVFMPLTSRKMRSWPRLRALLLALPAALSLAALGRRFGWRQFASRRALHRSPHRLQDLEGIEQAAHRPLPDVFLRFDEFLHLLVDALRDHFENPNIVPSLRRITAASGIERASLSLVPPGSGIR